MNTPRSTFWAERLIILFAIGLAFAWFIHAFYDWAFAHGAASVVCPKPVARLSYDIDRAKLLRRIRYEQMKGGVK